MWFAFTTYINRNELNCPPCTVIVHYRRASIWYVDRNNTIDLVVFLYVCCHNFLISINIFKFTQNIHRTVCMSARARALTRAHTTYIRLVREPTVKFYIIAVDSIDRLRSTTHVVLCTQLSSQFQFYLRLTIYQTETVFSKEIN